MRATTCLDGREADEDDGGGAGDLPADSRYEAAVTEHIRERESRAAAAAASCEREEEKREERVMRRRVCVQRRDPTAGRRCGTRLRLFSRARDSPDRRISRRRRLPSSTDFETSTTTSCTKEEKKTRTGTFPTRTGRENYPSFPRSTISPAFAAAAAAASLAASISSDPISFAPCLSPPGSGVPCILLTC